MERQHYLIIMVTISVIIQAVESLNVQTVTSAGTYLGNKKFLLEINREIEVYLGIPYAEPPIGDRRYKDPVPLPKIQSKIFGTEIFPPSCPQDKIEMFADFSGAEDWAIKSKIEEDCLYLNIWKPFHSSVKKPVIFWIHGGGFTYGSSSLSLYDGSYLAGLTDAIVVTIQYRLGALGFLYTGDDFAPGNAGLKDQVLALQWVNDNIDKFGGDKNKITIVGESSGGMSVGLHVLSPKTSNLFKRAILLSGTPNYQHGIQNHSVAYLKTLDFASKLGADVTNIKDVKKYLQRDWSTIVNSQNFLKKSLMVNFVPVIEPVMMPEHPIHLLKKASHLKNIELIVGWTKDEGSVFLAFELKLENKIQKATDTPFIYKDHFLDKLKRLVGGDNEKAGRLAKHYNETGERPYLKGLVKLYSDVFGKCQINQYIEEARKHGGKVYHLEYDYRTLKNDQWPEWFGAFHGADVEMLFGHAKHDKIRYNSIDDMKTIEYLERIKSFINTGNPNVANLESWYTDKMLVFKRDNPKTIDTRTETCAMLKQVIPHFLSDANGLQLNVIYIVSILILLRELF